MRSKVILSTPLPPGEGSGEATELPYFSLFKQTTCTKGRTHCPGLNNLGSRREGECGGGVSLRTGRFPLKQAWVAAFWAQPSLGPTEALLHAWGGLGLAPLYRSTFLPPPLGGTQQPTTPDYPVPAV